MTLKLSDKFLIESMKKRISALEIKLGQKTSEIDEFIFRNKALKQKIKDKDLEINFSVLEKRILNISKNYQNLDEKYQELNQEHEELKKKYDEERRKNQVLAEEQKNIKLYSAISGNPDHNRLMKNHINRLIKEVDNCIAELQNSGL